MKGFVTSLERASMCLKEFSSFVCVFCFFFSFSFCPKGELKAVLIAQIHRQQVILYMPSVVPSFVYLLLNLFEKSPSVAFVLHLRSYTLHIDAAAGRARRRVSASWKCTGGEYLLIN